MYKYFQIIFVLCCLDFSFFAQSDSLIFKEGNNFFKQKNYKKAITLFQKVIDINPKYKDAYYYQGYCFANMHKFKKASLIYKEYLKIDSSHVSTYNTLGILFQDEIKSKKEKPLTYYKKALSIDSINPFTLYYLGKYYSKQKNQFKVAEKWYLKSLNYGCEALRVDIYFDLGMLYYKNKLYKKAIENFTKTIDADKNNPDAYFYRSMSYFKIDEIDKYESDYKMSKKTHFIKGEYVILPCDSL